MKTILIIIIISVVLISVAARPPPADKVGKGPRQHQPDHGYGQELRRQGEYENWHNSKFSRFSSHQKFQNHQASPQHRPMGHPMAMSHHQQMPQSPNVNFASQNHRMAPQRYQQSSSVSQTKNHKHEIGDDALEKLAELVSDEIINRLEADEALAVELEKQGLDPDRFS